MKKKILSIILCIAVISSIVPISLLTANAAEAGTLISNSIQLQDGVWNTKYWTSDNYNLNCYNKFTIRKRGVVTFTLTKPFDDEGELCSYSLKLVDSIGIHVWPCDTDDQKDSFSENYIYKVGLKAGTYYLNIDPDFYIYSYSAPISSQYKYAFEATDNWEIESNNSQLLATPMVLNKMYSGVYSDESYQSTYTDYWSINLTKGLSYSVKVWNYDKLDAGTLILYYVNPNGEKTSFSSWNAKTLGDTIFFDLKPTQTGKYYILFANDGNGAGVEYKVGVYQQRISITNCIAKLSNTNYTYSGTAKKPTVAINGLIYGTDYNISYSNNTAVGKATVTITGIGNYTGSKKLSFSIIPKATSISSLSATKDGFKVNWKKQSTQVTGYQIQYSTSSKFSSAKAITVSSYKTTSKTVSKLINGNKYFVRVRTYKTVSGKNYYSGWSSAKSVVVNPKATSISSIIGTKGGFTVKWKKQSTQVTGYQIQYSTSSKFSSAKTITVSSYKTVSKTVSKLTKGKKYYVRVRTYKTISGIKYYSSWSSAKSVTTKK